MAVSVSYLIPCYNVDIEDLRLAINSVVDDVSASKIDTEILISDDHSDEENFRMYVDLAAEMSTSCSVNIIRTSNNLGLGGNLNFAIRHCRGDYIFRLDPDDRNLAGRTSKQLKLLKRHGGLCACGAYISRDNSSTREAVIPSELKNLNLFSCRYGSPFFHSTLAFEKRIFDVHSYADRSTDFDRIEDLYLIFDLLHSGVHCSVVRQALVVYSDRGDGLSKSNLEEISAQKSKFLLVWDQKMSGLSLGLESLLVLLSPTRRKLFLLKEYFKWRISVK